MEIITADLLRYHFYACIYIGAFVSTLLVLGLLVNVYEWFSKKIDNIENK